jgi:hypothetical protein
MANLPRERLETPPPFTNVGFDVFGPDYPNTKTKRRSSQRKTLGTDIHVFKLQSRSYRGVGNDGDELVYLFP